MGHRLLTQRISLGFSTEYEREKTSTTPEAMVEPGEGERPTTAGAQRSKWTSSHRTCSFISPVERDGQENQVNGRLRQVIGHLALCGDDERVPLGLIGFAPCGCWLVLDICHARVRLSEKGLWVGVSAERS